MLQCMAYVQTPCYVWGRDDNTVGLAFAGGSEEIVALPNVIPFGFYIVRLEGFSMVDVLPWWWRQLIYCDNIKL